MNTADVTKMRSLLLESELYTAHVAKCVTENGQQLEDAIQARILYIHRLHSESDNVTQN